MGAIRTRRLLHVVGCVGAMSLLAFESGCRRGDDDAWQIDLAVRNAGGTSIAGVAVRWGEHGFTAGIVGAGHTATQVRFDWPPPETATVLFAMADGREVSKQVAVKKAIPRAAYKDRDMTVRFVVDPDREEVTVEFLHFIETEGGARLVPFQDPRGFGGDQ